MEDKISFTEQQDSATIIERSRVTPEKQPTWIHLAVIATVVVLVVIIGLGSQFLSHATPKNNVHESGGLDTHALEDNLAHLKAQVDAAKAKHPEIQALQVQNKKLLTDDNAVSKELLARMNAPTSVLNGDATANKTAASAQPPEKATTEFLGTDANSRFANTTNNIDMIEATRLPHPEYTIAAGEIIPAVLESAITSDLPGMIRAVVSRDVYSLQGAHRLIPKGATLIGQYSSGIVQGQSRILVVWERVQLSNGVVVSVASPGTDVLGRAGLGADWIDTHFMEKFATSALLSVMGAYTATTGVNGQDNYNSAAAYRASIADSFQGASQQALMRDMNIKPTLNLNQGALVNVFVTHDLSFYRVLRVRHG